MIWGWLLAAVLWGAAIALICTTWYFQKTFTDLGDRLDDLVSRVRTLEANAVEGTIVVASSERELLQKIADLLEADDETVTH